MAKKRGPTMNVELPDEEQRMLEAFCDPPGGVKLVKRDVMGALIRWFVSTPEPVRHAIIGRVPAGMEGDYRRKVLEYIAEGLPESVPHRPRPNANDYTGPTDYRFNKDDPADGGKGGDKPKGKGK
jgi:hypothetical protein